MSRISNSEKYIICKNFLGKNLEIIHLMEKNFINKKNMNLYVNSTFYKDINNFNEIFVNNQINNINILTQINQSKTILEKNFFK